MGVFSRLTDIINSNINSILDKAEDPDKIIRMVIQEMEDTLIEVRSSAAKTIADQKDVERRLKRLSDAQADWEKKAELAISKGREDLAKGALIEKSKVADMAAHLEAEFEHLKEALGRHEEDVIKLEAKLREARAKKATLQARHKTATNHVRLKRNLHDTRIQEAFDRFDKVESRLDRIEGEAEAYELGKGENLADTIQNLETNDEIEKELEELKAKAAGANDNKAAKKAAKKSASK
jgi:phage shock protein A